MKLMTGLGSSNIFNIFNIFGSLVIFQYFLNILWIFVIFLKNFSQLFFLKVVYSLKWWEVIHEVLQWGKLYAITFYHFKSFRLRRLPTYYLMLFCLKKQFKISGRGFRGAGTSFFGGTLTPLALYAVSMWSTSKRRSWEGRDCFKRA